MLCTENIAAEFVHHLLNYIVQIRWKSYCAFNYAIEETLRCGSLLKNDSDVNRTGSSTKSNNQFIVIIQKFLV